MTDDDNTPADDDVDFVDFLREEGLELLALYRRIKDPVLRAVILDLIKSITLGEKL